MALSPLSNVLPFQPKRQAPVEIELNDGPQTTREGNALKIEVGDGSVVIDLNPTSSGRDKPNKFDDNLAEFIDAGQLGTISSELLQGIMSDDQSRQEWLNQHAEGIKLLGLTVEETSTVAGEGAAPLEGMTKVRHPLLLEAVLQFQANAIGELLPAAGPVRVRDDEPQPSEILPQPSPLAAPPMPPPMMGHNGGPPMNGAPVAPPLASPAVSPPSPPAGLGATGPASPSGPALPPMQPAKTDRDVLADALETDFNHYLTTTAQEYYPDTRRMLFGTGFGGQGVKKVYNCPIRRRPVSESVDIENFIVSNALTDLSNAGRITHRIKMRQSTLKRMQLLKVYRDVPIGVPQQSDQPNAVDLAKSDVIGVNPQPQDPRDADYTIYECYCELVLDDFAPRQFKGKELPLPYRVTIEKDTETVLEIRRNWREDDEQCLAREYFVEFPYVKAFGWYGIGLLHILGNTTKTLTAAWREFVDACMFANFPGFLYAKPAGRQYTNQFRVAPGSGVPIDVGMQPLNQMVMPLPYHGPDQSSVAFIQHVEEDGQRIGGTANISVAEGRQDAPVGTTLALIEQATKPLGAVLKGLHTSQAKELELLGERFRDDPEAFWRFNKRPAKDWEKLQFIQALDDFDLVPVSDPNNPTSLHRAAKADFKLKSAQAAPGLFDLRKVWTSACRDLQIQDGEDLLAPPMPPQPPPIDPHKQAELALKAQGQQTDAQLQAGKTSLDMQKYQLELQDKAADRTSRERIAMIQQETARLNLAKELAIHGENAENQQRELMTKTVADHHKTAFQVAADHHGRILDAALQPEPQANGQGEGQQ